MTRLFPFGRRRIFFVYTHGNRKDRFKHGLTANTEISYWVQRGLKEAFGRVHFLRFQGEKEWRIRQIRPQDVVIGHIGETYTKARARTKHLIAFYPWCGDNDRVTAGKTNCSDLQAELDALACAQSIIFLTSEFNVETYIRKPTNFWYDFCRTHPVTWVHQPIDLTQFKRIKTTYTTSHFLYVGNNNHMKCVDDSIDLVQQTGRKLTLYGVDKKLSNLDQKTVSSLADKADFFIQPGLWEAQCVSILEAAARGFIPIVSEETGYPYSHPYLLKRQDPEYNLKTLHALLKTSPAERKELADHLYDSLARDPLHNDWGALTQVLVREIKRITR